MRLLHLADLHLGWEPSGWPTTQAATRAERRDGLLARVVDVALEERPDIVVIAGDLFETFDPQARLVEDVLRQLRRLESAGILTVTLPGNHDEITYAASVYRARSAHWPGVLVTRPMPGPIASLRVAGEDVHLYGLAYTGGVTPANEPLRDFPRSQEPGMHLATFHGTLGLPAHGERSLPLDEQALAAAGYHYVALGHIHRPGSRSLPGGPAVYPGCIEGKGFDDPGVPFLTFVSWDGTRARVDQSPFAIQPIRNHELDLTLIDGPEDIDDAIAALADADAIQLVRLTGASRLPELDVGALAARHASSFFHLVVDDSSVAVAPDLVRRWAAEPTIRGAFVARMQARLQAAKGEAERADVERALRFGIGALQGTGSRP